MIYFQDSMGNNPLPQLSEATTRCWVLVLNMMRGRSEESRMVACCDNRHELEAYWLGEKVEPYDEPGGEWEGQKWHKTYRKGGHLEWYNPPWADTVFAGGCDQYGNGIHEMRRDGWRVVS